MAFAAGHAISFESLHPSITNETFGTAAAAVLDVDAASRRPPAKAFCVMDGNTALRGLPVVKAFGNA